MRYMRQSVILFPMSNGMEFEAIHYYELLPEAGVNARLLEYRDSRHGFTMEESADTEDALRNMAQFLQEHFKG